LKETMLRDVQNIGVQILQGRHGLRCKSRAASGVQDRWSLATLKCFLQ
jgi:hypothetical protein